MAENRAKKVSELPLADNVNGSDTILIVKTINSISNTYQTNVNSLISNTIFINEAPANSTTNVAINTIRYANGQVFMAINSTAWGVLNLASF